MMIFDHHYKLRWLHTVLSTIVLPIEYTVAWPTKIVNTLVTDITSRKKLIEENKKLREEHLLLQSQLQRLNLLQEENTQLRGLLRAAPKTGNYKILAAQQLETSIDPFIHEVVLDTGANQSLFVGQPILDAQGVLGQLIQINPLTSRALLITDTRSAIPVQNTRTGERAILVGSGLNNTLYLKHILETTNIQAGDKLVCSGLGGYFPAGYPVGVVKEIKKERGEDFALVIVEPTANLNHHQVLLIWPEQIKK